MKEYACDDLPYRAWLAIPALIREQDPRVGKVTPFSTQWTVDPVPCALHSLYDYGDGVGRTLDALNLLRIMTGSRSGLAGETLMHDNLLSWIGLDGQAWIPVEPWLETEPFVEVGFCLRGTIMALTTLWQRTGDESHRRACEQMIEGVAGYATHAGDYCYLASRYRGTAGWLTPLFDAQMHAEWNCVSLQHLLRFYEHTGFEPAFDFSRRMIRFVRQHTNHYHPDGSFDRPRMERGRGENLLAVAEGSDKFTHFHSRSAFIAGALKLGILDGDDDLIEWAVNAYRSAYQLGTTFGWFPEKTCNQVYCETCSIVDMIEIAILLARHVDRRYWADVERAGRNHLLSNQIRDMDWTKELQPRKSKPDWLRSDDPREYLEVDLAKRIGGFVFSSLVNDLGESLPQSQTHNDGLCCHAAGARGLYDLWHYAVEKKGRDVWIHLYTTRETEDVQVRFQYPHEGRAEITIKNDCSVYFRAPIPVRAADARVCLNGKDARGETVDGYLKLPGLKRGDVVILSHPLLERQEACVQDDRRYRVTWKGETVTAIDPPGTISPVYRNRDDFVAKETPDFSLPLEKEIESV